MRNNGYCERDSKGRVIYAKAYDGRETWWNYDEDGRLKHYISSNGLQFWYTYDTDGKLLNEISSDGTIFWFNKDGVVIRTEEPVVLSANA